MHAWKRAWSSATAVAAIALLACASASSAQTYATYDSPNFRVEACDPDSAKLIAEKAEEHRKSLAISWLGEELPAWRTRCPIRVDVTFGPPGGRSGFDFERNKSKKPAVNGMKMELTGPLDAIVGGVLPHEVMHCVVTSHFGKPVPRWADEGLAILAESDEVQTRTAAQFRDFRSRGRTLRVQSLLELKDYPDDRFAVYLQGYSVAQFLTARKDGKRALLNFLNLGMTDGWDAAAKAVYGFTSIAELEGAWADWLDAPR